MLVLTRHLGERVLIGEETELVVLSVTEGAVRLGFMAPLSVKILRAELGRTPPDAVEGGSDE